MIPLQHELKWQLERGGTRDMIPFFPFFSQWNHNELKSYKDIYDLVSDMHYSNAYPFGSVHYPSPNSQIPSWPISQLC